ncbi:MAG: hypothetical protein AAGE52_02615 [Myxococcota bacterium]
MRAMLLLTSFLISRSVAADCPQDTHILELPDGPEGNAPVALVHVRFSGGDPWAGPSEGACVTQRGTTVHLPAGEARTFSVQASDTRMQRFMLNGDVLHISIPAGSELTFSSAACTPYRLSGPDLDVVTHRGERHGAASEVVVTGGPPTSECSASLDVPQTAQACRFTPQAGYCAAARITLDGVRHFFWPRHGERWKLNHNELTQSRVRATR